MEAKEFVVEYYIMECLESEIIVCLSVLMVGLMVGVFTPKARFSSNIKNMLLACLM